MRYLKMLIDGSSVEASDGSVVNVINPVDGLVIDTVPNATAEDIGAALASARAGFDEWKSTPLYERISAIYKFSDLIIEQREHYAELLCNSTGKTYRSCINEADGCARLARFFGEKARNVGG
jgi:acyl-CoA reductase-like NAD-dependent aldehyde dehydrogenase